MRDMVSASSSQDRVLSQVLQRLNSKASSRTEWRVAAHILAICEQHKSSAVRCFASNTVLFFGADRFPLPFWHMLRRALPSSGPARTQHFKAQQKEQALADAREREAKASKVRIVANTKRVATHLLSGLGTQLDRYGARAEGGPGPGAELTAGWTVEFDLPRVSGDPEGVQRGQRINSKDRSVVYVTTDGQRFASREAIAKHFGLEVPEEEVRPADKNGKPKKPKPTPPPYEPPPVQMESGQLAFEVERVLDVRPYTHTRARASERSGYG